MDFVLEDFEMGFVFCPLSFKNKTKILYLNFKMFNDMSKIAKIQGCIR